MKENSKIGTETLEGIAEADHFNKWMFDSIKPFCSGEILEIGSGIGNLSDFFIKNGYAITLSDISKTYFDKLNDRFKGHSNFKGSFLLDFAEAELEKKYPELIGQFDTVFALNVLEHIPNHNQAVKNCYKLLKPGGKLIILVPAFNLLFNNFDEELEHQRRYTMQSLSKVFEDNQFEIHYKQYFNFMGIMGWFFSGRILQKRMIPNGQLKFYDLLVPIWKLLDIPLKKIVGLSIIQVAQKIEKE